MTAETENVLGIGDGGDWHFVNGAWVDGESRAMEVPADRRRDDGPNLQGHHYAFHKRLCYNDVRIRLEFRLNPHSDAGIILRSPDPSHFYLMHFPNCGQGSRAQHFWAAFSRMDETGYLKRVKMEMVRRVPSNNGIWLTADVQLIGSKLTVRVGDHGHFEAEDHTISKAGSVGVFSCGLGDVRNVVVTGTPSDNPTWDDGITQPTNWLHPCPKAPAIWQKPQDLLDLGRGELLLSYVEQDPPYRGENSSWIVRSQDNGRTWQTPTELKLQDGDDPWQRGRLHITPAGRLIALLCLDETYRIAESDDGGRTWSEPAPVGIGPKPKHLKGLHVGPQAFVNCRDGSMVMFLYGGCDLEEDDLTIFTWGSLHCQAFACRSTDDGRTWSAPVNIDCADFNTGDGPAEGNMDLTEVCGVETGTDGQIVALVRPVYSPWMWETWSHDGGATWSPCVRGPFPGYATPAMLRTSSGAILVSHRLPSMTIHCSWDDGHTWDEGTMIDGSLWVMGQMVEIEPDVVLYVYYDSHETLMRAQFIHVTPSGLIPVKP